METKELSETAVAVGLTELTVKDKSNHVLLSNGKGNVTAGGLLSCGIFQKANFQR